MMLSYGPRRVKLSNASGDKMATEETYLFVSVPGGGIKRVKVVISSSVKSEFLVCWRDQISLGILHKDWPKIPGHFEQVNAVRTEVDDDVWPSD